MLQPHGKFLPTALFEALHCHWPTDLFLEVCHHHSTLCLLAGGHVEAGRVLIARGADPAAENNEGDVPLDLARPEVQRALLSISMGAQQRRTGSAGGDGSSNFAVAGSSAGEAAGQLPSPSFSSAAAAPQPTPPSSGSSSSSFKNPSPSRRTASTSSASLKADLGGGTALDATGQLRPRPPLRRPPQFVPGNQLLAQQQENTDPLPAPLAGTSSQSGLKPEDSPMSGCSEGEFSF